MHLYQSREENLNKTASFSFIARIKSFRYAFAGIAVLIKTQHNARIHLIATTLVIGGGLFFQINYIEWCLIILAIMAVWVSEALNTAIEFLCDIASPAPHPLIKKSKDLAAGAVLISAAGAMIIGLIVFMPYFH
ncbi:MAG TPA: diacylglycerol kinase family protein [Nitrosomonas nitrosa]|uniref:Diacylglycerol kinase (ATP) n=1 Tax=Nitrosomonas nitrosa TaxID=52442 RepID=A0A1I4MDV9_9PROT|nr:Undecaprenol kinase [Nitrosomonas nitrosa]SFM01438.1 diacylglycerol kinase (ATP) [Nitrosomonas nitrosa]HBZ31336.1 diacylglycerol kinase family protein [Nitrosomonas nitrosa]